MSQIINQGLYQIMSQIINQGLRIIRIIQGLYDESNYKSGLRG